MSPSIAMPMGRGWATSLLQVSSPVAVSTANTTTLPVSWLLTNSHRPVGSKAKYRGTLPPLETRCFSVSSPVFAQIR